MTKPLYTVSKIGRLADSLDIDELTQTIILRARNGNPLPESPILNHAEEKVLLHGAEVCRQDIENLTAESDEYWDKLKKLRIDMTAPNEIESQYETGLKRLISEQADSYKREKSEFSKLQQAFEDFRNTCGINREPRVGSKTKALTWTIIFFILEGVFNSIQLFTGGTLPGGLIGACAISFLVGAVNVFAAYFVGEHIWKYTKGVNHDEKH